MSRRQARTQIAFAAVATFAVFVVQSQTGWAATPKRADYRKEFVQACIEAFDKSSGNGESGVGKPICECTAKESKHQGVTQASLKAETAKIKADPKYRIQDRKLMSAFQYCSIEILRDS